MGDVLSTILWGLLAGIIIGPLARLVLPGKQNMGLGITILIGAVGAIAGGFIASALGVDATSGIDWIQLAIQVAVAALVVILYGSMVAKRGGGGTAAT